MNLPYTFSDPTLLEQALTHRSWAKERVREGDNERLEFLGDAVLQLVATELVLEARPDWPEGALHKTRSALVRKDALARLARTLDLGPALRLGRGEAQQGGREKSAVLADAFEAVAAAVWLDGGLDAARTLLRPLLQAALAEIVEAPIDAKSALQEALQARGAPLPVYRVVSREGPAHALVFHVEVVAEGATQVGSGRSKAAAEADAARRALEALHGE